MLPAAFLGLAHIHSPKFSPSQQIPGQFMALRTSSSGCKGLMADFEYIWGQLAISVARRLWEAGLRGPGFARHWRASFKRRNATGIALFWELGWSPRIKTLLRIIGRNEESSSDEKRAARMKCAKEMASLVDCTEKEINALVGSRSEGNCNSDLIRKFKGGGVYLEIAKSRIISLFYRINQKFIQLSFGP